jgi:hypothetical protein
LFKNFELFLLGVGKEALVIIKLSVNAALPGEIVLSSFGKVADFSVTEIFFFDRLTYYLCWLVSSDVQVAACVL